MGIPWSVLGRIAVRSLPTIINTVEVFKERKSGPEKLRDVVNAVQDEIISLSNPHGKAISDDPKVQEALRNATNALVAVQNVIAQAELEAVETARSNDSGSR